MLVDHRIQVETSGSTGNSEDGSDDESLEQNNSNWLHNAAKLQIVAKFS